MSSLIKIYKDDPTVGDTDGTEVSSGTGLAPVSSGAIVIPDTDFEEGSWVKLAVRCDRGYGTVLNEGRHARITIEDSGSVNKWQLAPDDNNSADEGSASDWGELLDFTDQIIDENTVFWVRARAEHDELPQNNTSVQIRVEALIGEI